MLPFFASVFTILVGGAPVHVKVAESISSATARKGDTVEMRVTNTLVSGGRVLIAAEARGAAKVLEAEQAGKHGHPGKLVLQCDWVYAADGEKIALADLHTTKTGKSMRGASSTAVVAGTVLFGPVGLFAHNFVKGRDVVLDADTPLTCVVDHTVHVRTDTQNDQR